MTPSILIDNTSAELSFRGKQWQSGFDSSMYGGSYTVCRTESFRNDVLGRPSKLSFGFIGTGVEFYGQASKNLTLNYTLDASSPQQADLTFTPGIPGKTGVKLWEILDVTPNFHTISVIPTGGEPIFDYIVVHPVSATPFEAKTLIVDDGDAMINYSGNWTANSGAQHPEGLSYNSTRSGTRTAGDSFQFRFVGSSVAVYGLLNRVEGKLASTYVIDGGTATRHVAYDGSQASDSNAWSLHQRFFFEDVVPGNHTLTVTVEEVTGSQTFWLDYVTFGGTSGTRLSPSVMTSSSSNNPFSSSSSSHSKLNTIIGIAVVVVIFFSVLSCCCRNRLRQRMFFWINVSRARHRGSGGGGGGIYMPSHVQHAPPAPLPSHHPISPHQPLMTPASSSSPYTRFSPTQPPPVLIPPRMRMPTPMHAPVQGPLTSPSPSTAPAPASAGAPALAPAPATTTTAPARPINNSALTPADPPASATAVTTHAHSPVQDAEPPPPYSLTDQDPSP